MSVAHLEPFNALTGRQAGLRSAEVRAELLENGKRFQALSVETSIEQQEVRSEVERQIGLMNEQIERTRAILNDETSCYCEACERGGLGDKERAGLLRELRGMLEHLCRLRGIGEPARTRSVTDKLPAMRLARVEPVELPACTPTPSVPPGPAEPEPNG